jgi:hypothetical protein
VECTTNNLWCDIERPHDCEGGEGYFDLFRGLETRRLKLVNGAQLERSILSVRKKRAIADDVFDPPQVAHPGSINRHTNRAAPLDDKGVFHCLLCALASPAIHAGLHRLGVERFQKL